MANVFAGENPALLILEENLAKIMMIIMMRNRYIGNNS